jgi:hypothetical protein
VTKRGSHVSRLNVKLTDPIGAQIEVLLTSDLSFCSLCLTLSQ